MEILPQNFKIKKSSCLPHPIHDSEYVMVFAIFCRFMKLIYIFRLILSPSHKPYVGTNSKTPNEI